MSDGNGLVLLNVQLVLSKAGFPDLVYEKGTLLKVMMISNDHVVVKDDQDHTFILNDKDQHTVWSFF
ncbi:hypothetical protein [Acinetobacter puyangensis]|uniref:hypothetical protein n=1 Tax=Acinetobacter puyangensis TaxID=1096779 RepID=UPI003A4D4E67